jgi:hypothetical protein
LVLFYHIRLKTYSSLEDEVPVLMLGSLASGDSVFKKEVGVFTCKETVIVMGSQCIQLRNKLHAGSLKFGLWPGAMAVIIMAISI